jgi:hypothetical protein
VSYTGKPYVLGVDPGMKTGLSFWSPSVVPFVYELMFQDTCAKIEDLAEEFAGNLCLVVESFTITVQTAKKTQAPWSLEVIGACRYLAGKYGCELVFQAPSSAKLFSSDERLRSLDWWVPGKGHGNDASRHVLLYAATHGWWSEAIAL